jgi:hypothetical protein
LPRLLQRTIDSFNYFKSSAGLISDFDNAACEAADQEACSQIVQRIARNFTLLILLLALTGGQWALLQTAAWAGMLVQHLRSQSLAAAVSQTFDGQHPCAMCKAIAKQKSSEKKPDVEIKLDRIDLLSASSFVIVADDQFRQTICCENAFALSLARAPLLRPPRSNRV